MNEWLSVIHEWLPVWNVSRAAGSTSYLLLFFSVVAGMSIHYRSFKPGTKARMNFIHQAAGWFGMLFGMIHGLVLTFSTYESFSVVNVLVPFTSTTHPFLIGLGVLALYSLILIIVTSDYMNRIGKKAWKTIHFLAFPMFIAALLHGIMLGPDTREPMILFMYISTASIVVVALIVRIVMHLTKPTTPKTQKQTVHG
jgi:DMSO/TMAO reductase YedYZ heme-binding membrane subunit